MLLFTSHATIAFIYFTSPSNEYEVVALIKARPKWRVEKKRIPARKGRWQNKINTKT